MKKFNCDFLICGGGIVGLTIAHQLIERKISKKIIILDKERQLGLHSSGRNSGVLHAGIYYEPNSLKAEVCIEGANRLKQWMENHELNINKCGKLIIPQKVNLDKQLDTLYERGKKNGAYIEYLNTSEINRLAPYANVTSGRALWSPATAVVKPLDVINKLIYLLEDKDVKIFKSVTKWHLNKKTSELLVNDNTRIKFGHFINSSGLQADKIAQKFEVGLNYKIIPFKGIYWKLRENAPFNINLNLYPVPDLNVPFLGVHFTPNSLNTSVDIGPTAVPALGRENYKMLEKIEFKNAINDFSFLAQQYFHDNDGFRKYVNEQAFLGFPMFFLKSAQELIPNLKYSHIEPSKKVGLRAQLFDMNSKKMIKDFLCLEGDNSTHILNSISPAFTASFAFADFIINKYLLK
ncbi:L-2-hydroxyglutarate oxidase [Prochlorococcus marinus XMU1412]|uniref:L-2-hydroxyglutarate oxidase n=1 Tax=Prochlorococcus marinus TaxID=1219 RepID=UPI001ADB0776|nr:L-2-hydroxyglutarate oxidase [Prochlorococcus marinus]MBO8240516.1 L-2-hydroxyglutarate oxidase [Prochlorococcus marinus XMU1412]MBW3071750.1 L-2-hydroxyglutarate oxidase [Prochlorococcus marinus str. MU1412]